MCQLGICTFSLDNESNSYIARPFNIFTLPNSSDHPMNIHPSSMKFLVENGFDMNKLFKNGIYCTRIKDASLLPTNNKKSFYKLGRNSEEAVMSYVNKVLEFVNNRDLTSFQLDVPSKYVKDILQGPCGALKYFKNLKYHIFLEEIKSVMKIDKIQGKEPIFNPPQRENLMTTDEEIFNNIGATLIFAEILKKKIPLVLHNSLFDIGYLYTHFIKGLPNNLDEFKNDIITLFPSIYDTKAIAKSIDIPALKRVNLEGLYQTCLHSITFKDTVRYCLDDKFHGYLNEEKTHEAAYDAYITGVSFLHLREYLKKTQNFKDN